MRSPPNSTTQHHDLHGASRVTGGFARGRAQGNVYNFADEPDIFFDQGVRPTMGKVLVYTMMGNPNDTKPIMSLKHEVCATLRPVLAKLTHRYTQIDSKFSSFMPFKMLVNIILETNVCIWVYEDDMWDLKGKYESAMEEDEEVVWQLKNNTHVLMILVVRCYLNLL